MFFKMSLTNEFYKKQLAYLFWKAFFYLHQKSKKKTEAIFEQLNLLDLSFMILTFEDRWKYVKIKSARTLLRL